MGAVWLFIIYLLAGWVHRTNHRTMVRTNRFAHQGTGRYLLKAGIGFGGVWIADLISNGNPIWPGLAIVAAVLGETVPMFFRGRSGRIGLTYWGCLLYLNFGVGITCAAMVLADLAISRDPLAAQALLVILAPVLVRYADLNPLFFWMTIAAGFFIVLKLKDEIFLRVTARSGSGDGKDDKVKLR